MYYIIKENDKVIEKFEYADLGQIAQQLQINESRLERLHQGESLKLKNWKFHCVSQEEYDNASKEMGT